MARTTLPPQADEAPTPRPQPRPPTPPQATEASPWPRIFATVVRIMSLGLLISSIVFLVSNSTTITINSFTNSYRFKDVFAYRYAVATAVIGSCYTFLLLIISFEQMRSGKVLLKYPKIHVYEFLGDKVVFALATTGVGAVFGSTVDLKSTADNIEKALAAYFGDDEATSNAPFFSKFYEFFDRVYIPIILLLCASLTTGISSILSSLPLFNNNKTS